MMKTKNTMILLMAGLLGIMACGQPATGPDPAPPGYDWSAYQKILLSENLLEISGIAFAPGEYDNIYGQQDEAGSLFKIDLKTGKYQRYHFGKSGDYEDIAILKDRLLVMRSDGSFYACRLGDIGDKAVEPVDFFEKILPKGEYEGLFADPVTDSYYALCKSSKKDKKNERNSVYQLSWKNDQLQLVAHHELNIQAIKSPKGKSHKLLTPSAIARHPLTGEWYIVSSVDKLIAVANAEWKITATYPLSRKLLLQPEGLAFDQAGNMYISSEGDELEQGRILKFDYTQKKQ